jgi:cysteine synthase
MDNRRSVSYPRITFASTSNTAVHRRTTTVEIWTDSGGEIDVLVAAVGTSVTLMGIKKTKNAPDTSAAPRAIAGESCAASSLHCRIRNGWRSA